jgi:hypothetical protein
MDPAAIITFAPVRRALPLRPGGPFRLVRFATRTEKAGQGTQAAMCSNAAGRPDPAAVPASPPEQTSGGIARALRAHYAAARARLNPAPPPPPPRVPTLAELFPYDESPPVRAPSCSSIFAHVCAFYGVTMADLLSARTTQAVARPRQIAMHLARELTARSLPEIGARLGKRDHTTVLYGARRAVARMAREPALAREVAELTRRILARETPESR